MKNLPIKDWAEDDRPREKLLSKGANNLSNSELLAILIVNGTPERSAIQLAKDLLTITNNDLQQLATLSASELIKLRVKGLGKAKAISIAAAFELGSRLQMPELPKTWVKKSKDVAGYLCAQLMHKSHEVFAVLFVSQSKKIIHFEIISEGGITSTIADPRIIFKKALSHNATGVILCHNHPGGTLSPSATDISLTRKLKAASDFLDIEVLDHIIVCGQEYYSFADNSLL
ncbi:MAG: DNA repair protein RadC [Filimonas sp.]|nr:DNA repair protein RadC [Filimonas sp.]